MKALTTIALILLAVSFSSGQAATPLLERQISINFQNEKLDQALTRISDKAGFSFSYPSSIIDRNRTISFDFQNKTIRQILDEIFRGEIEYKERSRHIILTKPKKSGKDDQLIKGYIIDETTGERLRNVTVYEPVTLSSAVTNSFGYFEIKAKSREDLKLVVNRENYTDTIVDVQSKRGRLLNIPIHINKEKIRTQADSLGHKLKRFWKNQILNPANRNLYNVTDTLYRTAQFSIVPFVGTNHRLSGNVINDWSFNLLGGYSLGVRYAEVGGLFNLDRGDVEILQFAGLFNTLGGKMKGLQMAGVFNANYQGTEGAQFAGVANINWNTSKYFSLAGALNFTRISSEGVHVAGAGNFTLGEQKGPHAAGLFNFSTGNGGPVQVAGLLNFTAKNFHGFQFAGLANFTGRDCDCSQISGGINFSGRRVRGSQIAVVNYASRINGSQLGLINIADSISGIPIGLISLAFNGYHKIEISADEIFYTNIAFRTGARQFYNILSAGAKPDTYGEEETIWTFGYGFGTAPKINRWLYLNFDLTANQVMDRKKIEALNLLNKLYLGVDLQASKNFSITLGATLNGYLTEMSYEGYKPLFTNHQPSIVKQQKLGDYNLQMWWGGKIGLRFL